MYRRNEVMAIDGEIFNWAGKEVNNIRKIMRFNNAQHQKRFPYNVRKNNAPVKRVKFNRVPWENDATLVVWPMVGRTNYYYRPNLPLPSQNWNEYDWDNKEKIIRFRGHRITEPGTLIRYRTSDLTGAYTSNVLNERHGELADTVYAPHQIIEVVKDDRITQINGGINREDKADIVSVYGRIYGNHSHIIISMPREFSNTVSMDYDDDYLEWANLFSVNGDGNTIIFNIDQTFTFNSGLNTHGWDRPISLLRVYGKFNNVYFNFKAGSYIQFESNVRSHKTTRWSAEDFYTSYKPLPGQDYWIGRLKAPWIHALVAGSNSDFVDIDGGSSGDGLYSDLNSYYIKGVKK